MKRGFNWKARQVVQVDIDNSKKNLVEVVVPESGNYDKSNEFLLPGIKRNTKIKDNRPKITRILSNKHRKRLEKVVERKKKKENRASLLAALSKVQATPEELNQLTSISSMQTKGLKKLFHEERFPTKRPRVPEVNISINEANIDSISGSKRQRIQLTTSDSVVNSDPNVVGFDSSSESDENSERESDSEESKRIKVENDEIVKVPVEKVQEVIVVAGASKVVQKDVKVAAKDRKPAVFVELIRTEEIQAARMKLPILAEEYQIMEVISENSIVIIAGETGSGKTTQLPQFLYEAGYARNNRTIAVTQPRRVAAITMSQRVAHETALPPGHVAYLIRFAGNATADTRIKFMTDGVLLREMQSDFLLGRYSVVVLDEAHERSVYTDILVGLLSRVVRVREKRGDVLKVVIMSATLRLEDFTENRRLFKISPPVVKIDVRQFPVTVHFNKRTRDNYLREAYTKACKVHNKLPEGGILIFVTGQAEVNSLVRKLRKTYPLKKKLNHSDVTEETDANLKLALRLRKRVTLAPTVNLDDYSLPGDLNCSSDSSDHDDDDDDNDNGSDDDDDDAIVVNKNQPLWVLPLYSHLPSHRQQEVFQATPVGCRLCVVATNVAETSLTIPGVKYVVDTGRTKKKLYDKVTGVTSYVVDWTSKASADQRAGRAGRTGPGHCYRLYSSAVFNDVFMKFAVPEIQQKPVDDLYLQMKCMGIDRVVNFPFPTAPDLLQLKTAEYRLEILGALSNDSGHSVTPLGRAISRFPLLPRYGKMLALSHQHGLLPYTVCLVAALSVQEVLLETPVAATTADSQDVVKAARFKWRQVRQHWAGVGNFLLLGDAMVLLKAVGGAEYANNNNSQQGLERFCHTNGLRLKALLEIRKMRVQLTDAIRANVPDAAADVTTVSPQLQPPTDLQAKLLRQILLAGLGDQIARKVGLDEEVKERDDKVNYKYAYRANNMETPVFLHQGSVLKRTLPEFVVYQEIYETNKMYMRGVTAIEPDWLPKYVPSLCNLSEPLSEPPPRFDAMDGRIYCTVNGTFGLQAWPLTDLEVEFPADGCLVYRWFGRFLLEGVVCPHLARYRESLLGGGAATMMMMDGGVTGRQQPRVQGMVGALRRLGVRSRGRLQEVWQGEEEKQFLLSEYLRWLPKSAHEEVSLNWPPPMIDEEWIKDNVIGK